MTVKNFVAPFLALGFLSLASAAEPQIDPTQAASSPGELDADWAFLQSFVPAYNRVWTSTPLVKTEDTVNAPVMGNGNMCVCVSGGDDAQVYYMRTADFWTDDGASDGNYHQENLGDITGDGKVREIPSGCLLISVDRQNAAAVPTAKPMRYRQEEDMLHAEVLSTFPFSGYGVKINSYVAATENTMVVKISSSRSVKLNIELNTDVLDRVASYPSFAGVDGNVLCLTRETSNRSGARWISRNAYATRIFGASRISYAVVGRSRAQAALEMPANTAVTIVTCLDGGKNAANSLSAAKVRLARFTKRGLVSLEEKHRNWWKTNWWLKSYVRTYDDTMDKYYYRCLYWLGTMCREGSVNSGLHGPWKASDTRHNYSSYCMNDLGAASYYIPLISSGRASTAKMWIQTVDDWMPEGRRRAIQFAGLARGVFYPVHWAPWGSTYSDVYWGQKYCASLASLIGNWYYRDTEDVDYLRSRIYPFMKECANFYEDWLTKEADGKYHVRGASYESKTDDYQNSCLDLVYAGILFTDIVKYSKVLGVDSERRAKWEDIRDHLKDFSTTSMNGLTVYQADSKTAFDFSQNIIQTQVIYPGYSCNRRSASNSKQIGYNTILQAAKLGGWGQDNMRGQGLFVAAQRIGRFKVDELIAHYKEMLVSRPIDFPKYIADAGLWEFNNQLCLQSFDRQVMFCPDYPPDKRLSFKRLLAPGAFLCSGEFNGGTIAALTVHSQKGNPFTAIGPWGKSSQIEVSEFGGDLIPVRKNGDTSTFDTVAGRTYKIVHVTNQ